MKPIDLTNKLENARADDQWTLEQFSGGLGQLSDAIPGSRVDWDVGAGEAWGRVLLSGEVVAIVWRRAGFFLLDLRVEGEVLKSCPDLGCYQVVRDWEEEVFCVDLSSLLRLTGRSELSSEFSPHSFSANQLWWATI